MHEVYTNLFMQTYLHKLTISKTYNSQIISFIGYHFSKGFL